MERIALNGGMGNCSARMYGLGFDPLFPELGTPTGNTGSGVTTGTVNTTQRRPSRDDEGGTNQSDTDCPCEITTITENKTVTIPVKSEKIICKPTTVRTGKVDCDTIQAALANSGGGAANTNNNTAGGPANLLGLGDINAGFNIDLVSLAIGAALTYVVVKVI